MLSTNTEVKYDHWFFYGASKVKEVTSIN